MSTHKSLSTSAVPSDCVVGSVALNCGPFGSVLAYTFRYPLKDVPSCTKISASKFVSYQSVPFAGSLVGAVVDATYDNLFQLDIYSALFAVESKVSPVGT